jgi:hypothetical protein
MQFGGDVETSHRYILKRGALSSGWKDVRMEDHSRKSQSL